MPIWARVAERCWPHVGHANLTSGAGGGGGNVEVFGTATAALQFGQRTVMPIWARVAERCRPQLGHANLRSISEYLVSVSATYSDTNYTHLQSPLLFFFRGNRTNVYQALHLIFI
jgi:hypothetical protein